VGPLAIVLLGAVERWLERVIAAGLQPWVRAADLSDAARADHGAVVTVDALVELRQRLEPPRIFLLDGPADAVDAVIDPASREIEPGDVVLDLAPSWWCDTLRRHRRLRHRSLYHLDLAELAGPEGRILLVGGDARGFELARPVLEALAAPGRVVHAGGPAAAHWAAEVAAGLATARAQAESEARALLEAFPNALATGPVAAALGLGTAMADPRALWLPDDALRLQAPTPLLAQAAMLELGCALDEERERPPPPRLGPFALPEEIL
jgi:6-phosphogluconate dehydrogenase (decarboxylating)